ncbi:MAG: VanW family protein [Myxococcota bacterium]
MMQRTPALVFFLSLSLSATAAASVSTDGAQEEEHAQVLSQFETEFRTEGRSRRRALNVELAAKLLNGAVIEAGETLSFNDRVGERSAERGFVNAPVIANGRIRQGLGGGVCQVSTTLHVAALQGGLEIVEHRTHSRPSSYVDAGLDATVSWGRIDYKVRNPYAFPVRVHAFANDGVMQVSLEIPEQADAPTFEIETHTIRRIPVREEVVQDEAVSERTIVRTGREGLVVRVTRISAEGEREVVRQRYRAARRVVHVPA